MPRDISQLSLQNLIDECPIDIHIINNRPLQKLIRTYNLQYQGDIKASWNICDYPHEAIIIGMDHQFPKIFFNGFRVWMWSGWQNHINASAPYSIGFSPSYVYNMDAIHWCLELLMKTKETLDHEA